MSQKIRVSRVNKEGVYSEPGKAAMLATCILAGVVLYCYLISCQRSSRIYLEKEIKVGRRWINELRFGACKFIKIRIASRTRGHGYKLYKNIIIRTRRNRPFSTRVVNPRIELDEKTITVSTVEKFKRQMSECGY